VAEEIPPAPAETWAARLRRGDAGADRELRAWVRRFLASRPLGAPAEVRRDLEQEIVTDVWKALRRSDFDPERELLGFVRVVTARRTIDWLRARRAEPALAAAAREPADPGGGPLAGLLARERLRLMRRALRELGGECRELVRLQIGERLPYREIAQRLGRSEGALRVQMHRCVDRLRRRVEGWTADTVAREG
jgi:RNA polymerase sigma-70 factor (ECF subfamily)